jgi:hypothetical protein
MKLVIVMCSLGFMGLMYAGQTTEEKLADALIKANRQVSHDQEKAQEAGAALNAYCQQRNQIAGIRRTDGNWGCVSQSPAQPAPPPTTNHP